MIYLSGQFFSSKYFCAHCKGSHDAADVPVWSFTHATLMIAVIQTSKFSARMNFAYVDVGKVS